jgi:hypothetical protein
MHTSFTSSRLVKNLPELAERPTLYVRCHGQGICFLSSANPLSVWLYKRLISSLPSENCNGQRHTHSKASCKPQCLGCRTFVTIHFNITVSTFCESINHMFRFSFWIYQNALQRCTPWNKIYHHPFKLQCSNVTNLATQNFPIHMNQQLDNHDLLSPNNIYHNLISLQRSMFWSIYKEIIILITVRMGILSVTTKIILSKYIVKKTVLLILGIQADNNSSIGS